MPLMSCGPPSRERILPRHLQLLSLKHDLSREVSCFSGWIRSAYEERQSSEIEIPIEKVELAPEEKIAIPIEFALPEKSAAQRNDRGTQYSWQLDIKRAMRGVNYATSFSIRVEE